ncbi:hypothetical protein FIV42_22155 [Persicimonas caeni]|uniref:Uncharacterized protein n=1 Tax=Persicimonas caeni TaxID=2292766 RepID=A0A4Y6PYP1_PERCE|nr:hypothetical protein [Persicimonas caeni]QDG53350.1 hypothetical protein FIV42_22155 [Persicimonas caeni]QED34571.1 hypothetical protein FRD00_22150 [Persicimonas caeni]
MIPEGTYLSINTSLVLGIQFDEVDYRRFLRDYHADLRKRFSSQSVPAYAPHVVLDSLMLRLEPDCSMRAAGSRWRALQAFADKAHRLDLCLTGSDFGDFEKRRSPYHFDRSVYHLGRCLVSAQLTMEFPGYNPYRSTRKLDIPFMRENLDGMLDYLPDYLWWELHDQKDMVRNILAPEQLFEVRRRLERAGYKLDQFGLYLTNMETLRVPLEKAAE